MSPGVRLVKPEGKWGGVETGGGGPGVDWLASKDTDSSSTQHLRCFVFILF